MDQLNHKLKGSSLVEVLVAMVLIMAGISLSILIYISVISSDKQTQLTKAGLLIQKEVSLVKSTNRYIDEEFIEDGIVLTKQILDYKNSEQLRELQITASDTSGRVLQIHSEIISVQ